ncbi:anti-sigma factor family protein [Streptomyces sp. NPDC004393]|uniref:anti-sigma factor family protein n=1 Tax=Streptomyces sp. NPDC004533 TaxID=3154278 RepID=UPI0033B58460
MTSTTGTAGHPDVEELSDLSEGLLAPSRTADIRRHLEDCTLCADVYDSLEEIRGLLGTLPVPQRMPDDVASRIDAALAAEVPLGAMTPGVTATPSATSAVPHVSRETSTASPIDRPSGHSRAATGPGRAQRTRRGGRRTIVLGAVFTTAALGLSALLVQTVGGSDTAKTPNRPTALHTDAAHTYAGATLEKQVTDLLAGQKTGGGRAGSSKPWGVESQGDTTGSSGMESNRTFQDTTGSIPRCVEQAIHTDQPVLASDKGVYQGTFVYLLVAPDASAPTRVTAYIVDAACVKKASVTPGTVLLTRSYARP